MKALDTFRQAPWRHNCAQAIANRWSSLYSDPDIVSKYAPYVGGRAPEGLCGALYAAMQACPQQADKIQEGFKAACGATHCHELKGGGHVACEKCVATADKLVEDFQSHPCHF